LQITPNYATPSQRAVVRTHIFNEKFKPQGLLKAEIQSRNKNLLLRLLWALSWPTTYEGLWEQITLCSFALGKAPDKGGHLDYAWQAQQAWASGTSVFISKTTAHIASW
jgi:hypothetical protein